MSKLATPTARLKLTNAYLKLLIALIANDKMSIPVDLQILQPQPANRISIGIFAFQG